MDKKIILIIAIVAVLVAGITAVVLLFLVSPKTPEIIVVTSMPTPTPPILVPFPVEDPYTVNMKDDGGFVKINIVIGLNQMLDEDDKDIDVSTICSENMFIINDLINKILRSKTRTEYDSQEIPDILSNEITIAINDALRHIVEEKQGEKEIKIDLVRQIFFNTMQIVG